MVTPTDPITSRQQQAQRAADRAERDAAQRIAAAEKQVREAQLEAETKIDEIRDQYVRRGELEHERRSQSLVQLQEKGYQELGRLKQAHASELNRTRDQGERELRQLQDHYRDTLYSTMRDGETELTRRQTESERERSTQSMNSQLEVNFAKEDHARRMSELKLAQETQYGSERDRLRAEYEKLKAETDEQREIARGRFGERYANETKAQTSALERVNREAALRLAELREDTEAKLAAYSRRQRDPFYRLVNLDAELREESDAFVLSARVPEHERANVSVSIQGGGRTLVVQGHRRAEESLALENEPGRTRKTSSYQSFSESFPLHHPVDARSLVREFDGDYLVVWLPKKPFYDQTPMHKAKAAPERARAERPNFPKNLAVEDSRKTPERTDPAPVPSPGRPGSKTLG
jgi:HSP20 family molecular chaperone IbpA